MNALTYRYADTRDDGKADAQDARRFQHHHRVCVFSIECDCDERFGPEAVEPEETEDVEDEPDYCRVCDGTGEGMMDGRSCRYCRGTGFERRRS